MAGLLCAVFTVGAIFGVFHYTAADRDRDLHAWQGKLGIVADSRSAAVERWL